MYTQAELNLIALSELRELSYQTKKKLLHDFATAQPDFSKYEKNLIKTLSCGVYNKVRADFSSLRESVEEKLESLGVSCVTYFSESYPAALRRIDSPPVVLYCKGDTSLLNSKCFAVVGSRRTSPKTLADCEKISGEISSQFTVVTGIADGADSAAIKGALKCGGRVISVFAGGLDCVYPAANRKLADDIRKNGLLVSEYPCDTKPLRYNFPFRNRIIAGLSRGLLVVSGGENSGTLHTANYAMQYGKDVFAFPHNVGAEDGRGCNALIKKGAYLTENILDISEVFGLNFNTPAKSIALSQAESQILKCIIALGDAPAAEVARMTDKQLSEVIPVISSLQIKKLIVSLGGNRYSAV